MGTLKTNSPLLLFAIVSMTFLSFFVDDAFGQLSMSGDLYSNEKRIFEPIVKVGKEFQIKVDYTFDSFPTDLKNIRVFIIDNPMIADATSNYEYSIAESLFDKQIESESSLPETLELSFTPKQTGNYALIISSHYENGNISESIELFAVVDTIAKSFNENNLCRSGFLGIIKPSYSDAVCVTENTRDILLKRGWSHPNEISGINQLAIKQSQSVSNIESFEYEDLCGFAVTEQIHLDAINDNSHRFTKEGIPYFEMYPGVFSHVTLAPNYLPDDPHLNYWFDLDNGKTIYFRIGACDVDGSEITRFEVKTK